MNLPEYKIRVIKATVINQAWNNCEIADVEYDAMMRALFSKMSVKQQDYQRLSNFLEKRQGVIDLEIADRMR